MDGPTVGMLGLCLAIAPQVPVGELWWPDLYNLKSKKLVGIVSVHNCSLRRPIISEAILHTDYLP
jgi:hypothetical protein